MNKKIRLIGIDIFRGWAILLMVVFHFSYDLQHFNIIDFHIQTNTFFQWFRFLIVTMFLLIVGVSLKLTHLHGINWKALKKRTLLLGSASIAVTIGSYIEFPNTWIYFGILHFVLVASFITLPLLNRPFIALFIAISTFIAFHLDFLNMHGLFNLLVIPLHLPSDATEDVVRFIPWITFVLIGIALTTFNFHQKIFNRPFFNTPSRTHNFFSFIGRYSLIIYLIHQPILFGGFLLFN